MSYLSSLHRGCLIYRTISLVPMMVPNFLQVRRVVAELMGYEPDEEEFEEFMNEMDATGDGASTVVEPIEYTLHCMTAL